MGGFYPQGLAKLCLMEQVRVGLIGVGGFARYRVGNLLKVKGAVITAMADTSADNITAMKEAHPATAGAKEFSDYKELLKQNDVDAVMIMTPHTLHAGQIIESLEAGKHTCVEKPMVTTVDDAHKVIAAQKKAGKVGMVSYQRHFESIYKKIKSMIDSGEAGEIQYIAGLNCQEWKVACAGTWRHDPALSGGGQLNDTGSHFVDIILYVTGLKAETVSAIGDNRGLQVDIDSALAIRFSNGAVGTISIIGDSTNWHEDMTIMGTKLGFFVRSGKLTVRNLAKDRVVYEEISGGGTPDQHFVDCITKGIPCESGFECGLEVIRLTEAAWKSMDMGGAPVKISSLG
jgi:predicted dehydrogenase